MRLRWHCYVLAYCTVTVSTQQNYNPMIALRDSDRKIALTPGPDVMPFEADNFKLVPPVLSCSQVTRHRYSYSETPGCNLYGNERFLHYLNATSHAPVQGRLCCDHVVTRSGMSSLCMCQRTTDRQAPRAIQADAGILEVDALIVLPPYWRHAPHWLEELAQLCNALSLDAVGFGFGDAPAGGTTGASKFPAVLVELPLTELGGILDKGGAEPARAAASWPSAAALRDKEAWADEYCSVVTAAVLQATTYTIIHAQPQASGPARLVAHLNVSSADGPDDRRGHVISRVETNRQIHRHESIRFSTFLPFSGRHFFASRRACDIFRHAIQTLWKSEDSDPDGPLSSDGGGRALRVMIANRVADPRTITNVREIMIALRSMEVPGYGSVDVHKSVRQNQSFAEMFRSFAEADVVVVAHGGTLAFVPAMRPGSLVIEVFADPELGGTCLSFFLGLGTQCGVAHRVYHGSGQHMHILNRQGLRGCWLGKGLAPKLRSTGHRVDPAVIVSMIQEWRADGDAAIRDRVDNPSRLAALQSSTPCKGCKRPGWWEQ